MIGQLAAMDSRTTVNTAGIDFEASMRKTKRLVEFDNVTCQIPGGENDETVAPVSRPAVAGVSGPRTLFSNLNFILKAGMKVGLVGPNGSGKTTLLRLLLGEIEPVEGTIKRAEALRMVYLSQMRELDESLTLRRALAPEGDGVNYQGRIVHVASWAARFLFTGEQLNQPVRNLSGGERARVLIAKLMLEPADVLLLDEPTNDLDIPSLEILEDNLLEFPGALVLVLDGRGSIGQFADFAQWEDWLAEQDSAQNSLLSCKTQRRADGSLSAKQSQTNSANSANSANFAKKKLSYLEAREFAAIEQKVEASDTRLHAARDRVDQPEIASDAAALQHALAELDAAQHESDALYARWAELTEKAG
jgi:ATP-binding cassette subfamily F protein uup